MGILPVALGLAVGWIFFSASREKKRRGSDRFGLLEGLRAHSQRPRCVLPERPFKHSRIPSGLKTVQEIPVQNGIRSCLLQSLGAFDFLNTPARGNLHLKGLQYDQSCVCQKDPPPSWPHKMGLSFWRGVKAKPKGNPTLFGRPLLLKTHPEDILLWVFYRLCSYF